MYVCAFSFLTLNNMTTIQKKMNGAELPCGTCIKVEPSDPMYQLRKKKETPNYYGSTGVVDQQTQSPMEAKPTEVENKEASAMGVEEGTSKPETGDAGGEDGDDLDDFFASL
mmetsp:Transcript_13352/g.32097  ORF Transcript_13352/g.32097 Transcript_13352/m.32097 type:complete len:112 (+) Transcript_13352:1387-1722(+)